jgi:autotransporter-associated beta strand protein
VLDDGKDYKVWIDGVLYGSGTYSRPTGLTKFRWGSYLGSSILTAPSDVNVILVSGAQIQSWPGKLTSTITSVTKANNTQNLNNGGSWSGGVVPGLYQRALWNNTVTAANTTTLGADQSWSGIRIVNPGGTVTINGTGKLGLNESGVDMSTATRSLVVACPMELTVSSPWSVAPSVSATFNGAISGYGGFTLSGGGTVVLGAANSFSGITTLTSGTLSVGHLSALASTSEISMGNGALLRPTVGGATINAPITVANASATALISAPTNLPGGGVVSAVTLAGGIQGAGNVTFTSSADQNSLATVHLATECTYEGDTRIDTAGTTNSQIVVRLGTLNALPTSTTVTIDGQLGGGTGRYAEINLNGFSQELAGLANTPRSLRLQRIVNSDVSTPATLTLNSSASTTFSGDLGSNAANGSVAAAAMTGSTNGNNFGLTKRGVETFTASGTISYSGNTTVSQGTLELRSPNGSNDASTVTISQTGATLNLAFSGTDTVARLFIGSTQMPPGVYEAVGNPGAGIELAQIVGNGTLTVTSGPSASYATWGVINRTSEPIDGDHDNDRVENGIEFFVGGTGNTSGFTQLPSVTEAAGIRSVTWTKAASYTGVYGTDYFIETADAMTGPWTTAIATPTTGFTVTFPTSTQVRYTFPTPAGTSRFVRLKVRGP